MRLRPLRQSPKSDNQTLTVFDRAFAFLAFAILLAFRRSSEMRPQCQRSWIPESSTCAALVETIQNCQKAEESVREFHLSCEPLAWCI